MGKGLFRLLQILIVDIGEAKILSNDDETLTRVSTFIHVLKEVCNTVEERL